MSFTPKLAESVLEQQARLPIVTLPKRDVCQHARDRCESVTIANPAAGAWAASVASVAAVGEALARASQERVDVVLAEGGPDAFAFAAQEYSIY